MISILFLICNSTLTSAQNKKVVVLDSVQSVKIINQLVQGDFAKAELKNYKKSDSISIQRIKSLKEANFNLLKAFEEKQAEADKYKKAIEIQEKAIRREKNKKNFYKITSIVAVSALCVLIIN